MPFPSFYHTISVNTLLDEDEPLGSSRGQNHAGRGFAAGFRAQGAGDELDQARAVDELDRVFGGELLSGERECARRDEESFVAAGVMDCAQKFLKLRRADRGLPVIFALNDGNEPIIAAKEQVGPEIAGAANQLDLEAEHLEELADEFLERLGGE